MKVRRLVGHRALAVSVAACALLMVFAQTAMGAREATPPDTIFYNGKITTVDAANTTVQALAVRDGKILARGTNLAVLSLARRGTDIVNLQGRRMLPGLMDGTLHGIRMGSYFCFSRSPRFDALFTRGQALANVAEKASKTPPGKWLFAIGGGWHVNQFIGTAEDGMLTKAELDAAAPNHPVLLAGGGFTGGQMNTRGLQAMGYAPGTAGVNFVTGQVTGSANTAAQQRVGAELKTLTLQEQVDCTRDFIHELNRRGLTAWDDPGGNNPYSSIPGSEPVIAGNNGYQAINQLHRDGQLNARVRFNLSCFGAAGSATIGLPCVMDYITAAVSMVGDDMLKIGGVGEEVMNTAAGGIYPDPEYSQILNVLASRRWSLQHHIGGAAAQDAQVASWERVNATYDISGLDWVMLHPGGGPDAPNANIFARLKALDAGVVLTNSGIHGTGGAPPYRRAYESGVHTCSGTDALNVAPYPPFINAYYMLSGKGKLGQPGVAPDQTLTRLQALEMITSKCDWFMGLEGKIGVLEPGRYADLIVLSNDYFTVPEEQIMTLTSVLTMVGGRTVYSDPTAELSSGPRCVVPRVTRTRLLTARRTLKDRGCRTGAIRRAYSSRVMAGNVIRQSRRAGTVAALNARVNLVVSRGARAASGVR
jgi:predicted amidohydrolase YtcJ